MKIVTLFILGLLVCGFTCSKNAPNQIKEEEQLSFSMIEFKGKLTLEEKVWLDYCNSENKKSNEIYCLKELASKRITSKCEVK